MQRRFQHGGALVTLAAILVFVAVHVHGASTGLSFDDFKWPLLRKDRIIGGVPISVSRSPYMCSLRINGRHACGASVIAPRFVLTAAHCCKFNASTITINAGTTASNVIGQLRDIKNVHIHSQYNVDTNNMDFCILELSADLDLTTNNCKMIALNDNEAAPTPGTLCNVTGWGVTDPNVAKASKALMSVVVPVVPQKNCNSSYNGAVTKEMVCAGYVNGGKDSCQGDSGGPMASADGCQVGVVSWGQGCAVANMPGVYARVYSALSWIKSICPDARTCSSVMAARKSRTSFLRTRR